jgi:hypothetical protein
MLNERFDIADDDAKIFRRAAFAGRMAVAARVPREDRDVFETERFHSFLPAGGVFVTAMEKQQSFVGWLGWKPDAIKQFSSVPRFESKFGGFHGQLSG